MVNCWKEEGLNSKCSSRMKFHTQHAKQLPTKNFTSNQHAQISIKIYTLVVSYPIVHVSTIFSILLLNTFLLGYTTQVKISLNQWLIFLCTELFEKSDQRQKTLSTHKKMCISRPQFKNTS